MKTEKRKSAIAPQQQTARLSCRISEEAYQRLFVSSVMSKTTASEIVERAIIAHCKEWSLPGKIAARVANHDRVAPTPELNLDAPSVPLGMTG